MPYVMHAGDPAQKAIALYTRCEDELLAKAELVCLTDQALAKYPGRTVWGYIDVDPTFTIAEFMAAYRRPRYKTRLYAARDAIIANGWTYPERGDL